MYDAYQARQLVHFREPSSSHTPQPCNAYVMRFQLGLRAFNWQRGTFIWAPTIFNSNDRIFTPTSALSTGFASFQLATGYFHLSTYHFQLKRQIFQPNDVRLQHGQNGGCLFTSVAAFSSLPLRLMPSTMDMSSLEGPCGVCRLTSLDSKRPWGPDPCYSSPTPLRQRQYSGSMESSESKPQPNPDMRSCRS